MSRRNLELILLAIATPIVVVLFSMLVVTGGQSLSFNTLGVPFFVCVLFFGTHLCLRKFAKNADPVILPITFVLSGIGICFVERLVPKVAVRQLMWLALAVFALCLLVIFVKSLDKLCEYKYTFMILGVLLLLAPMLPVLGKEINGSRLWLSVGPFSFQPGEISKICIVVFLAGYLSTHREMLSVFTWKVGPFRLPSLASLVPLLVMWALAFGVVVIEKDLGSALVLFCVFIVMIYVSTGKKFYVVTGVILAGIAAVALFYMFDHVQVRVAIWQDPFADAQGKGYQIVQSLYSLADGDLFGVGIGRGLSTSIPFVESDFIFSAICEETGLLGACGVLLLYLCFAVRGMIIASRAKTDTTCFMAVGATSIIILQSFIIVAGVTRLIPLTGITLPFISQGGSSLVCGFVAVFILLRASDSETGLAEEMKTTVFQSVTTGGTLGRVALGKRLTNTLIIFCLMFAALVANITYIMVFDANRIQNLATNNHTITHTAQAERGTISTYDGVVLAKSEKTDDGTYERVYPSGDLATHVVGYYSSKYGKSGIEASCNETLSGHKNYASFTDVINSLAGKQMPGNDVILTLNSNIQRAAQSALSGYKGACVVMDPTTGAVLAMASSPTYDAATADEVIAAANQDATNSDSSLINRCTDAIYGPGSTFKIVTLTSAFENGVADENTMFESPASMQIGGANVTNFQKHNYGNISLLRGFALSSNVVFGQLATQITPNRLVKTAKDFGFNNKFDFDLPYTTSVMPDPAEMTEWETAWAGAGEPVGEHTSPAGPKTNALEMACVGSAIANGGKMLKPYLVQSTNNASGQISFEAKPKTIGNPCSADTASRVLECMKNVVTEGTAAGLVNIEDVTVAGKTGTAEHEGRNSDSWFVAIADADGAKNVVVAIQLEAAPGTGLAAQRARDVIISALKAQGVL